MSLINLNTIQLAVEKSFRSHGFSGTQGTADYEMAWKRNVIVNPGSQYQQSIELKVNLQDFRDVIAEAIFTVLTDKLISGTLSSGNNQGEQNIANINNDFNINESLYMSGFGSSSQTSIIGSSANISPDTTTINSSVTNIAGNNALNIYGSSTNILGTSINITGNNILINNPSASQFAARNGDPVLVSNSTDPKLIGWIDAVNTFITGITATGIPAVKAIYAASITSLGGVPNSASGIIASGSSSVRIGG